jgi:hypothetical protein
VVSIAGMSVPVFLQGGQHRRIVIKKQSIQVWSTSPEQVVKMDQNEWSRWIGIYIYLISLNELPIAEEEQQP